MPTFVNFKSLLLIQPPLCFLNLTLKLWIFSHPLVFMVHIKSPSIVGLSGPHNHRKASKLMCHVYHVYSTFVHGSEYIQIFVPYAIYGVNVHVQFSNSFTIQVCVSLKLGM